MTTVSMAGFASAEGSAAGRRCRVASCLHGWGQPRPHHRPMVRTLLVHRLRLSRRESARHRRLQSPLNGGKGLEMSTFAGSASSEVSVASGAELFPVWTASGGRTVHAAPPSG